MYQNSPNVTIEKFVFNGDDLEIIRNGEDLWVSVRRVCENLGLSPDAQRVKLSDASWACTAIIAVHDTTGRKQDHFMVSLRSLPMWLATINESKVSEVVRPKLVVYQRDAADALYRYVTGSSKQIVPTPSVPTPVEIEMRVQAIRFEGVMRMVAIAQQNNLASKEFLDRQIEESFARMKGEAYEPKDPMLDVSTFLKRKGIPDKEIRTLAGQFGKNLKIRFFEKFGEAPPRGISFVGGKEREVFVYKESHRPIFEAVFSTMFGHKKLSPSKEITL